MTVIRFAVDPSKISHERLQDEVIIINLASGAYLSGSGPAADLWTLISGGASIDEATEALALAYDADSDLVRGDVEGLVRTLIDRNVLSEVTGRAPADGAILPDSVRGTWEKPSFDEYTDMWDLLQFDPIHEVGEAGWPHAAPTDKA